MTAEAYGRESTLAQIDERLEEEHGPIVGTFRLHDAAGDCFSALGEDADLPFPVRHKLLRSAQAEIALYRSEGIRYPVHTHDVATTLGRQNRLTEDEAVSYAARISQVLRIHERDGEFVPLVSEE